MKLTEVSTSQGLIGSAEFDLFKHELKKHCTAFLRLMTIAGFYPPDLQKSNAGALYRATKKPLSGEFGSQTIRQDRKPRDMITMFSDLYDYYAEQEVGIKNLRARSMFCTGHDYEAAKYGDYTYYVFPVDGSRYFYSPGSKDTLDLNYANMQRQFYRFESAHSKEIAEFAAAHGVSENEYGTIQIQNSPIMQKYVFSQLYQESPHMLDIKEVDSMMELPDLIKNGIELMVVAPNYYYLQDEVIWPKQTYREFVLNLGLNL